MHFGVRNDMRKRVLIGVVCPLMGMRTLKLLGILLVHKTLNSSAYTFSLGYWDIFESSMCFAHWDSFVHLRLYGNFDEFGVIWA